MDDLLIFNRSLNASEILALYNSTANNYVKNFSGLAEGANTFDTYSVDNYGNYNETLLYVTVDLTNPNISNVGPADGASYSGAQSVTFQYNSSEVLMGSCYLSLDGVNVSSNTSAIVSGTNSIAYSVSVGTHSWQVNCTDAAGNFGNSSLRSLTVSELPSSSNSPSGSGVASFWRNTYINDETPLNSDNPLVITLTSWNRVRINVSGETHHIGVVSLTNTTATINVSSRPQQATLAVGESKKFEIYGDNYYDLNVKLNGITNKIANLTISYLHEEIPAANVTNNVVSDNEGSDKTWSLDYINLAIVVVGCLIILAVLFILYFVLRKRIKILFRQIKFFRRYGF